jgi:hypothetical protein
MNQESISLIDSTFDFSRAFKKNYCTLLNLKIEPVIISHTFFVDGIFRKLQYSKKVYRVLYREWQNQNWFLLPNPNQPDERSPLYWSSEQQAQIFIDSAVRGYGFVELSKADAFDVAQVRLNLHP